MSEPTPAPLEETATPTEEKPDTRRDSLRLIAETAEQDVKDFEGRPFTGPVMAEYMAYHAAAIQALAHIMETLLPPLDQPDVTPLP